MSLVEEILAGLKQLKEQGERTPSFQLYADGSFKINRTSGKPLMKVDNGGHDGDVIRAAFRRTLQGVGQVVATGEIKAGEPVILGVNCKVKDGNNES